MPKLYTLFAVSTSRPLLMCVVIMLSLFLKAQQLHRPILCGNEIFHNVLQSQYTDLLENINSTFDAAKQSPRDLRNDPLDVDVVVHVVWKEEAENLHDSIIHNQIDILNRDFNRLNADTVNLRTMYDSVAGNANIHFHLSEIVRVHTDAEFAVDILGSNLLPEVKHNADGGSDGWDHTDYINIWVCKIQPIVIFGFEVGQILGFSFPPNNLPNWPENVGAPTPEEDGLVIDYRVFGGNNPNTILVTGSAENLVVKGRTPVHEMGHFLGLRHIWGDGGLLGPNDCAQSDGIDDTPFANAQSNFDCDTTHNTCAQTEDFYHQDMPDMIENYMDYSSEDCMNVFTKGQVALMRNVLNGPRVALITETAVHEADNYLTDFLLSPNPARDFIDLKLPGENDIQRIRMVDLHGKIALDNNITLTKGADIHVDIHGVSPGIYIIQALGKSSLLTKKVIVR